MVIKEHPIIFNAAMIQAILHNDKTQTRRPIKPQPYRPASAGGQLVVRDGTVWWADIGYEPLKPIAQCPFGVPGDHLWVRETWRQGGGGSNLNGSGEYVIIDYRASSISKIMRDEIVTEYESERKCPATIDHSKSGVKWHPSIHMPRWASRITLEVVRVWIEQVQDITEADAKAEGTMHITPSAILHKFDPVPIIGYRAGFRELWDSFYIKRSLNWSSNPWLWVIEFVRLEAQ